MHSFGYGLPVITHGRLDFQMPEIAAFENGVKGLYFGDNDAASLCAAVDSLLSNPEQITSMGRAAFAAVEQRFNTAIMADRFVRVTEIASRNQ